MSVDESTSNPLISTKPSESSISILLHPLVLLSISDHVTRHIIRQQPGPIVGALLGQQNGRTTTIEQAFQCKSIINEQGEAILDQTWFEDRLQQHKDVHKIPPLELVGWYTICPESSLIPSFPPIHKQVLKYNESALLLTFHPPAFTSNSLTSSGGKLPATVYESAFESDTNNTDSSMQVDGEDSMALKFRPVPFTIDTDETEMIAIDYVAKGAGSAAAVHVEPEGSASQDLLADAADKKGKKKAAPPGEEPVANGAKEEKNPLTPAEEDHIAGMTTRLNSVRMLQTRLDLLSKFLTSQPPSYLSDPGILLSATSPDPASLPHLRNIQALISRLFLLTPSPSTADASATAPTAQSTSPTDSLTLASQEAANDAALTSLLALLGHDIQGLLELGRKFATVEQARNQKGKGGAGAVGISFGPIGDFDVAMV